jgi:hypothetical protein
MDISVSVDNKGNLSCPDTSSNANASVTWTPNSSTINSIQSITATAGTFSTAPTARNNWTAVLGTAADLGSGVFGWQYTIDADTKNNGQKQKAPRILLSTVNEHVHTH